MCMHGINYALQSDELYFPYWNMVSNCFGYWLASPSAYLEDSYYGRKPHGLFIQEAENDNYNWGSHVGIFCSEVTRSLGLRPVVCLPSSVNATLSEGNVWNIN